MRHLECLAPQHKMKKQKALLAMSYFPKGLRLQYRRRCGVSRPCSGWERVGPPRSNHQKSFMG
jgi:hypothetical protein